MLAKIGSIDLTKIIENNTYVMEAEDEYLEWQDGYNKNHRVYVRDRVKGSFNVICDSKLGMDSGSFLKVLGEHTKNKVLTITCWVSNKAKLQTLSAYVKINTKLHTDTTDIFVIELEER